MNVTRVVMDAMPHKDYDVHTVYLTIKILEDGGYITYDTPVDTISIKREALMGVRGALKEALPFMPRSGFFENANRVYKLCNEAITSLDAVLSEGE